MIFLFLWLFYYYLPLFGCSFAGFIFFLFFCITWKSNVNGIDLDLLLGMDLYPKEEEEEREVKMKRKRLIKIVESSFFFWLESIGAVCWNTHIVTYVRCQSIRKRIWKIVVFFQHAWTWHQDEKHKFNKENRDRFWPIFFCYCLSFHLVRIRLICRARDI